MRILFSGDNDLYDGDGGEGGLCPLCPLIGGDGWESSYGEGGLLEYVGEGERCLLPMYGGGEGDGDCECLIGRPP